MSSQRICEIGGASRDRTDDLLRARQTLSQLSYDPKEEETGVVANTTIDLTLSGGELE